MCTALMAMFQMGSTSCLLGPQRHLVQTLYVDRYHRKHSMEHILSSLAMLLLREVLT